LEESLVFVCREHNIYNGFLHIHNEIHFYFSILVGFRNTKSQGILQVTDLNAAKKLPQHDFGNPDVHVTPSAVRLMTWQEETVDGIKLFLSFLVLFTPIISFHINIIWFTSTMQKNLVFVTLIFCISDFLEKKTLVKDKDHSFVTLRPKKLVGSSGSVWASNLLWLHQQYPNHFEPEVMHSNEYSLPLRVLCLRLRDASHYFVDTTTEDDIAAASKAPKESPFREYELSRLKWLLLLLQKFELDEELIDSEQEIFSAIETKTNKVITSLKELEKLIAESKTLDPVNLAKKYEAICSYLDSIIDYIDESNLSSSYRYKTEYTDAGPGVGVSNIEAKIRFAEMCRLERPDRQIRLHRAPGDSAQNEAERTNACIGDAMVDGGTLDWERYKPLDGMSAVDKNKLTVAKIEEEEKIL
jgi:hypothetical protein